MDTFWIAFVSVFVVVGPLGAVPTFAVLTRGRPRDEIRRIARRGAVVGAIVLAAFTLLGRSLLDLLGVRPDAFQVAGGALLFLTALEMLRGQKPTCSCGAADIEAARVRDDIAVVPVAIPLLAGPGAMVTVMGLISRQPGAGATTAVLAAVALTFLIAYPILRSAELVQRIVGASVLGVVQRVLGLVLAALSIQLAVTGLLALFGQGAAA